MKPRWAINVAYTAGIIQGMLFGWPWGLFSLLAWYGCEYWNWRRETWYLR